MSRMKIFSGNSNKQLAENISKHFGQKLSPLEIFVFPDGEKRVRILESVVGQNAIVIQPTNPPVDENYMELFFIVDGLKRSGAEFVTAVIPYLGYQRQDHVFRDGEAVSLEVVLKTLKSAGVDTIISLDLHSSRTESSSLVPIKHLSALSLFADRIKKLVISSETRDPINLKSEISHSVRNDKWSNCILVSPDMGGIRRIRILSGLLENMPYAAIEKDRDLATGVVNSSKFGEGSINRQKVAFIVDDMIASGKTIVEAAKVLKENRVEQMYVFATHAIFSKDAPQILQESIVKKVYVTDSVFISKEKRFEKLEVIPVADIIAQQLKAAEYYTTHT